MDFKLFCLLFLQVSCLASVKALHCYSCHPPNCESLEKIKCSDDSMVCYSHEIKDTVSNIAVKSKGCDVANVCQQFIQPDFQRAVAKTCSSCSTELCNTGSFIKLSVFILTLCGIITTINL